MARKLERLQGDPDIIAWRNNGAGRVYRACQRDDRWVKDPPPLYPFAAPVLEENKAQIPGVRRGADPTFLFLSKQYAAALEHYLEGLGATGWQMTQDVEAIRGLFSRAPEEGYPGGEAVFISYFHPEDMRRKLDEILSGEDYITRQRDSAVHTAALQAYAQKWDSDPPPFPETEHIERSDRH